MALKTLKEINDSFAAELEKTDHKQRKQSKLKSFFKLLSDILFYLTTLIVIYSIMSLSAGAGKPGSIAGYSCFTVMSSSMSGEIEKGSLIIVRKTEPALLQIGDDITYLREGGSTVTHRIIDVLDRNGQSGSRSFQTKGVNNANPDPAFVPESDVVGKVVLVFPKIGFYLINVSENIHLVLIMFLLCSLLSFLLRGIAERKNRKG